MGVIFQWWKVVPIYHLIGQTVATRAPVHDETLCGRYVAEGVGWLPIRHLIKFARLCKDCERRV